MRIFERIPDLLKLADPLDLRDDEALDVLGQCLLVCVLLDPNTAPDLKELVAKRIATAAKRPIKTDVAAMDGAG